MIMTDIPAAAIAVAGSSYGATSYIICAFVSGFLLATVIFWIINRKQRQDWQAEYRRLMGGVQRVYIGIEMHEGKKSCASDTYVWSPLCAAYRLRQLFNGE